MNVVFAFSAEALHVSKKKIVKIMPTKSVQLFLASSENVLYSKENN